MRYFNQNGFIIMMSVDRSLFFCLVDIFNGFVYTKTPDDKGMWSVEQ